MLLLKSSKIWYFRKICINIWIKYNFTFNIFNVNTNCRKITIKYEKCFCLIQSCAGLISNKRKPLYFLFYIIIERVQILINILSRISKYFPYSSSNDNVSDRDKFMYSFHLSSVFGATFKLRRQGFPENFQILSIWNERE